MTKCVICGKRLWFENWRSFRTYANDKKITMMSQSNVIVMMILMHGSMVSMQKQ